MAASCAELVILFCRRFARRTDRAVVDDLFYRLPDIVHIDFAGVVPLLKFAENSPHAEDATEFHKFKLQEHALVSRLAFAHKALHFE